jgi:hypothetical protein
MSHMTAKYRSSARTNTEISFPVVSAMRGVGAECQLVPAYRQCHCSASRVDTVIPSAVDMSKHGRQSCIPPAEQTLSRIPPATFLNSSQHHSPAVSHHVSLHDSSFRASHHRHPLPMRRSNDPNPRNPNIRASPTIPKRGAMSMQATKIAQPHSNLSRRASPAQMPLYILFDENARLAVPDYTTT